jgi:hypothetical protein
MELSSVLGPPTLWTISNVVNLEFVHGESFF